MNPLPGRFSTTWGRLLSPAGVELGENENWQDACSKLEFPLASTWLPAMM